jgi:hypothetical protein
MEYTTFETKMVSIGLELPVIKKMWFDENYGFGKLSTFNVYMRMLILGKTRIKDYLINYFPISEENLEKIVGDNNSWLSGFRDFYKSDIDTVFGSECEKKANFHHPNNRNVGERTDNCDQTDLTFIQWGTRKLTNHIN